MRNYLLRRFVQMVVLLLFVTAMIYFILNLFPGGPFEEVLFTADPRDADPANVARLQEMLGLDRPWHEQYLSWLGDLLTGNWGTSWVMAVGVPVGDLIKQRLGNTLQLTILATIVSLALGLAIGIYSAVKQYSVGDNVATAFSFAGQSMPTFWFGLLLIIIFAVRLRWLPAGDISTPGMSGDLVDRLQHLILPVAVLSLIQVALWSRFVRSSMLEVLRQDFLRTARAKGVPERMVLGKHALRNALIPVITVVGLDIPNIFSGAIITETIFNFPGMGKLYFDSVLRHDIPVSMGVLALIAFLVIASNLLADVLYAVVDPRIRYD
jgi:peptide/nickel transport system permease protein